VLHHLVSRKHLSYSLLRLHCCVGKTITTVTWWWHWDQNTELSLTTPPFVHGRFLVSPFPNRVPQIDQSKATLPSFGLQSTRHVSVSLHTSTIYAGIIFVIFLLHFLYILTCVIGVVSRIISFLLFLFFLLQFLNSIFLQYCTILCRPICWSKFRDWKRKMVRIYLGIEYIRVQWNIVNFASWHHHQQSLNTFGFPIRLKNRRYSTKNVPGLVNLYANPIKHSDLRHVRYLVF